MTQSNSPITDRFGEDVGHLRDVNGYSHLAKMISRGSCRSFQPAAVEPELIQLLCAAALASPTKSDLQQRDIVVLNDTKLKSQIVELLRGQDWIADAPSLLVFCGNNRRQRRLHQQRGRGGQRGRGLQAVQYLLRGLRGVR